MKNHLLNMFLITTLFIYGCTQTYLKESYLTVPNGNQSHLKYYDRFLINSNSIQKWKKTKIIVDKGDMLLVFAEGKNIETILMSNNLIFKVDDSTPQYAAINRIPNNGFGNLCYGYLMVPRSGNLQLGFKRMSKGEYYTDVFVISEINEKYLLQILKDMARVNPSNELFRYQSNTFIEENNWIFYTQVNISSTPPNAKVYMDEEFIGYTPIKIDKINKHHSHNLCIELENYSKFCDTFLPKNKSRFNVELSRDITSKQLKKPSLNATVDGIKSTGNDDSSYADRPGDTKIDFGKFHALIIGNNNYNDLPKLNTAINDAQAIASLLKNYYNYDIELIIDGTRRDILSALDTFRSKLSWHDNLLIYYAGHGFFDEEAERGYWLPINASIKTSADWVSNADITDKLKALKAKHVIVISDSCYSGTLTRGIGKTFKNSNYLMTISQKRSRTVLTSGGLEPVSDGGGGGHSVFALAFINALRENDRIMDGTELFSKIRRPVMVNAPQTPQYSDIRFAGHAGGDFIFLKVQN